MRIRVILAARFGVSPPAKGGDTLVASLADTQPGPSAR